ncbi:IS3 family transposase [Shewanella sp. SG41-4]|uniref:IS3 family transposase n=1 Tax=Shewanella sp. SG41-4 TaxID=2760976 RepID=UPI001600356E|nr:IS3 family transposase [Shewanella sp. SG41-4]MBB1437549.1 IS3 family transposase [Shewanella sp. SG41-4]
MTKRINKQYPDDFKQEAVALVLEQNYTIVQAAASLGITDKILYNWVAKHKKLTQGDALSVDERTELMLLRKENKRLLMEREIPKKGQRLLCERNEVRYSFINTLKSKYPISMACKVMQVSSSAYYVWLKKPGELITADTLELFRRAKALFKASRNSLGSRELAKALRKEGFSITRYRTIKLMARLKLVVTQRLAYKVTTKRKHSDSVADNLLNMNFNPVGPNQVWAGDVSYLKTGEGWLYLAVVMDLYSRRIVGWHISKRMTRSLVEKAFLKAYSLRKPPKGLVFHSDRGSQYTSKGYRRLLTKFDCRASMGDVGACWDNAVVERFFGSLKHDWLLKVPQPTRQHMRDDVAKYMKYYNVERLHSANADQSPIDFEISFRKVSGWT